VTLKQTGIIFIIMKMTTASGRRKGGTTPEDPHPQVENAPAVDPAEAGRNEYRELVQSTSQRVIGTTAAVYLVWHFIATLFWPEMFSPSLWIITVGMASIVIITLRLLEVNLRLAHAVWFVGLAAVILLAYAIFGPVEILMLLALLPLMAVVMGGLLEAAFIEGVIVLLMVSWPRLPLQPLPAGYDFALILATLATMALGWGLSHNLVSAIEASSYHYTEALKRLEEARQHRAEISVLLKEVSKANYQLDRLNRMLRLARERADDARQERDRFAMAVSHELRSPLNFIIGFSDLMVNSPETYGPVEKWPAGLYDDVTEIYRSSTHLLGLINDILDMGKMDARQMTLFRERMHLSDVIGEVVEMVELAVNKKKLWLRVELDPDLPEVYADRTRIRQVLLNLVTNSLRFTESGGITVRARCKDQRTVLMEVEDTGAGIAEEDLDKIFSEFRQVGLQNWRREEGTGLGLAIGRRFIELHGGEMGVTSSLGSGSNFFFTLPLIAPEEEAEVYSDAELQERFRVLDRSAEENLPLLVLLSADMFWAKIFAETLDGYKVTLLSDPDLLVSVCNQVFPRAVMIDQRLARHEAVQRFLQEPPYDLPVSVFALPVNLNRVTALPEGVMRYLLKPVSRHVLVDAVDSLPDGCRNLLVVDDDPGMVRFVTQSLRSLEGEDGDGKAQRPARDLVLLTAPDGARAMDLLNTSPVDAVLLDIDLPDISGLTLLEKMQADERLRNIPVMILSANDLPQALSTQAAGHFSVHLNRPFLRKELTAVLDALFASITPSFAAHSEGGERFRREDQADAVIKTGSDG